jgi:hypothetical protein
MRRRRLADDADDADDDESGNASPCVIGYGVSLPGRLFSVEFPGNIIPAG